MALRRAGRGFVEEDDLFYVWDRDLLALKQWAAELRHASDRAAGEGRGTPEDPEPSPGPAPREGAREDRPTSPDDDGEARRRR